MLLFWNFPFIAHRLFPFFHTLFSSVMDILLLSQYFDTLSTVGANSLFLEHDPATVAAMRQSVNQSFLKGQGK